MFKKKNARQWPGRPTRGGKRAGVWWGGPYLKSLVLLDRRHATSVPERSGEGMRIKHTAFSWKG